MDFMCGVSNLTPQPSSPPRRGKKSPLALWEMGAGGGEDMPTEALL